MDPLFSSSHPNLKSRLTYLEKENQWYFSVLDLVNSLGEIHRNSHQRKDPNSIFEEVCPLLRRLAPLDTLSLFLVHPNQSSFECQICDPIGSKEMVQQRVETLIENGTFAWALKQPQAIWVEEDKGQPMWLMQSLATRSTVLGMVVGRIEKEYRQLHPETTKALSIIIQHTAQAMENAQLYQQTCDQNRVLEGLVQKRTQALETRIQELQEFTYLASHDLKEPLRKLMLFGDRLKSHIQNNVDQKADDYLEIMDRAIHRLDKQIEGLLHLSRVTTQSGPLKKIPLNRVLEKVKVEFQKEIEDTEANIQFDPLPTLLADPFQISQVFSHLIQNALKFRARERPLEIRVTASKNEEGLWMIGIHDNGIGINPTQRDKIFKPFERLNGQSQYPGAGMGLSICRKILERHGGSVKVKSAPGEGASFFVYLPESD